MRNRQDVQYSFVQQLQIYFDSTIGPLKTSKANFFKKGIC
jgi:hypothetical protein